MFWVRNSLILFHIPLKVSGKNLPTQTLFSSCFLLVLIPLHLLMNLLRRRRNSLVKRYLWVKDKKELLVKSSLRVSLKVVGLSFKIAILVSSSWKKLKLWLVPSIKSTKISVSGLLVNNILNSLLVSFKRHSRSPMNLLRVSRLVSIRLSPPLLLRNSLIRLITPTGVLLSSLFASSTQSLSKERNSVLSVGVFPTNITILILKLLSSTLKSILLTSCLLLNPTLTTFLFQ